MKNRRIAVVSTDGLHVNQHFGKAERFMIYDLAENLTWVEDRITEPLSVGDPNHPFDSRRFNRIAALLADCSEIFVTRIGDGPAAKLRALGLEPVIFEGPITAI